MIIKNHISWNNNYENDGILYFAQRIVEMLDYRTIDLYRVPLSNTPSLIKEYINVYRGAAKAYNLEQIYHEFVRCYETDIILQEKFGDAHIAQIIKKLNASDNKIDIMQYLLNLIGSQYLSWCVEYLKVIVPQNRCKKKIEKAIRCFVPELLHRGYKRDDIYQRAKENIIFGETPAIDFINFIDYYDGNNKKFDVYFGLYKSLNTFKDILKKRMNIERINKNKHKLDVWENYFEFCKKDVEALDASAAAGYVRAQVQLFTTFYQYLGDYGGNVIQKNALVVSSDGEEHSTIILCDKYSSLEDSRPPEIGTLAENVITNLINGSRGSFSKLLKIGELHNRAISNNGLENGFLNLWSILEVICVTDDSSKIIHVVNKLLPVMEKNYLPSIVHDAVENLRHLLEKNEYQELINSIEEGENEEEKIAMFLLLPKYKEKFDDFVDILINYPVLRSRLLNIHDDFYKNKKDFYNFSRQYIQRITWHLYRIYRVRNAIAHNGKNHLLLKDLGEHLHSYVDLIIDELVMTLCITSLSSIENVFVDNELILERITEKLSESASFDEQTIKLIFESERKIWGNVSH